MCLFTIQESVSIILLVSKCRVLWSCLLPELSRTTLHFYRQIYSIACGLCPLYLLYVLLSFYKSGLCISGRFCGQNNPAPIVSSSNKIFVQFISDNTLSKKGFKATWKAVAGKCCFFSLFETSIFYFIIDHKFDTFSMCFNQNFNKQNRTQAGRWLISYQSFGNLIATYNMTQNLSSVFILNLEMTARNDYLWC